MSLRDGEPTCEFEVTVKRVTEKAMLCVFEGGAEHWIPNSQIADASPVNPVDALTEGTIIISEWIAKAKGLDTGGLYEQ